MRKKKLKTVILLIVAAVIAYMFLLPFMFMFFTSFKSLGEALTSTTLLPKTWTIKNYTQVITNTSNSPIGRWLINTIIVTVIGTALRLVTSTMAGYSIARLNVPFRRALIVGIIWAMAIPEIVTIFPLFYIFKEAQLVNTYWPLILPSGSGVVVIYYVYTFLRDFPKELEEAAYIDGASVMKILTKVIVPSIKPVLITQGFITFLGLYNNYLWSSLVISSTKMQTLTLGIAALTLGENASEPGLMMSATVITVLPVLIIFMFANKYIVSGFTRSGIK